MKYEQEVLKWFGSVDAYEVVVFDPHGQADLTCIGLDTPDDRRWELDAEQAQALAELLTIAGQALPSIYDDQMREQREEDEDDDE